MAVVHSSSLNSCACLTRKITRHSLEEIGAFFGGRDHSTVLYAVEKITKQFKADDECKQQIETCKVGISFGGESEDSTIRLPAL